MPASLWLAYFELKYALECEHTTRLHLFLLFNLLLLQDLSGRRYLFLLGLILVVILPNICCA